MKLTILAANGQIARLVEDRILTENQFKDVELTLMLRNAQRLAHLASNPRVTVLEGDLNNAADVEKAIQGQDMVFTAVVDHEQNNMPTRNIIAAMKQNNVKRVIATNILGIYDEVPGEFGKYNRDVCFNGTVTATNPCVKGDRLLAESGLDYTTLRLPWLNDRDEIKYTVTHKGDEYLGVSASRKSCADLILKLIANPSLDVNDSLGLADPATAGSPRPVY